MRSIKKLYRETYTGEDVATEMSYMNGAWQVIKEHITNTVTNTHISDKAVVIGNGLSRKQVPLHVLKNHRGGLLGSGALQSYGCNALYRDFAPHFLVANGTAMVKEIAESHYCNTHIVYTSSNYIQDFPGKFYLIPQDPSWNAGALATYLACFDGHKKIYMIGFDGIDTLHAGYNMYDGTNGYTDPSYGYSEAFQEEAMLKLFTTYTDVDFVRVMPTDTFRMPEKWKDVLNLRQITFRDMVLECDI